MALLSELERAERGCPAAWRDPYSGNFLSVHSPVVWSFLRPRTDLMRGATKAAMAATIVLTLTACSSTPALSSKNVTASMTALTETNLLTGDDVTLAASAELSGKRKDAVALRIEQSADGRTWSTVDEIKASGPKVELKTHVVVGTAGPKQFRATVMTAEKKEKRLTSSVPKAATVFDIRQLVRTLYYDESQAFQKDTQTGETFVEQHNYPGFVDDTAKAWADSKSQDIAAHAVWMPVPEISTISPDPKWTLAATACSRALAAPPGGQTFIVSIDEVGSWNGYPNTVKYDGHVTFLKGQLYFYVGC